MFTWAPHSYELRSYVDLDKCLSWSPKILPTPNFTQILP